MVDLNQNQTKIEETIKKLMGFMNLECQLEFREEKEAVDEPRSDSRERGALFVSLYTPENGKLLIGKNGQALKALEHVIRLALLKEEGMPSIILDVNDYRKSRVNFLVDLAKQAVSRVRNTQKAEALAPMSSYERRVVHMELASCPDISTESIGDEPYRRVVIKPLTF